MLSSGPSYPLEDQQTELPGSTPASSSAEHFREFSCMEGTENGKMAEAFPGAHLGKPSGNLFLGFLAHLPRALKCLHSCLTNFPSP